MTICKYKSTLLITLCFSIMIGCSKERTENRHYLALEIYENDELPYLILAINGVNQRLNWISPGDFMMGSHETEEHRDANEALHKVTLTKGFWMAETEVTQELWETLMQTNPSNFNGHDRPVEHVSWYDANDFLDQVNEVLKERGNDRFQAALPTETQWEYACRAGTQTAYSWGDEPKPGYANHDNAFADFNKPRGKSIDLFREKGLPIHSIMPVKTFEPNAWGLYDMHGNVFEWTRDLWGEYSRVNTVDPSRASLEPDFQATRADNDDPSSDPERRVVRGGAWYFSSIYSRSAYRYGDPAEPPRDEQGRFTIEGMDRLGFRFILEEIN